MEGHLSSSILWLENTLLAQKLAGGRCDRLSAWLAADRPLQEEEDGAALCSPPAGQGLMLILPPGACTCCSRHVLYQGPDLMGA